MQWDLYCRVVDNFGDIGIAWRIAADLAGRGELVRLAVDDPRPLAWMAPRRASGVEVVGWHDGPSAAADVVVELFGGGRPAGAWRARADGRLPLLLNIEHLTAEPYAERSHGLPSPAQRDGEPASTTWFFFPGFTPASGGLLREPGLLEARTRFGRGDAWLASIGIATPPGERRVSVFSYPNEAIEALIEALAGAPTLLLAAPGPAAERVASCLGPSLARGPVRAVCLPFLSQSDFDRLLWSCDLNCVRGEDSLVRAIWAGAPFLWQLYVQDDGAHRAKLDAFLERFLAGASAALRSAVGDAFSRWNALGPGPLAIVETGAPLHAAWAAHCSAWRDGLAAQSDLVSRLIAFARAKR